MRLSIKNILVGASVILAASLGSLSTLLAPRSSNPTQKNFVDEQNSAMSSLYVIQELTKQAALGNADDLLHLYTLANLGDHEAQYFLGHLYSQGKGVQTDLKTAVYWWQKSAEQQNIKALYDLGIAYRDGDGGLTKDPAKAAELFRAAAEQGYDYAQYNLARLYEMGLGVERDYQEAAKWYRAAVDQQDPEIQYRLGNLYERGEYGIEQDFQEAVKWYQAAVDQQYAPAQHALGRFYSLGGGGLPKDLEQAKTLFRKAAEQGNTEAQYTMGKICAEGTGVKKVGRNFTEAIVWWERAAQSNHIKARHELGRYYKGKYPGAGHVQLEPEKALKWLEAAAKGGHSGAQKMLGDHHLVVTKDREEAIKWWRRAEENGNTLAEQHLKNINADRETPIQSAFFEEQNKRPLKKNKTSDFPRGKFSTMPVQEGGYAPQM